MWVELSFKMLQMGNLGKILGDSFELSFTYGKNG
jgi:hypothetical protein